MKKLALITALAATSVVSSFGQVTTEAVGFNSVTCLAGSDTRCSVPLSPETAFVGVVGSATGVGPAVLTPLSNPAWVANQFASYYYVKMTSGARAGWYYQITSNTNADVTIDLAGDSLAIAANDSFRICRFWTLATLFPPATQTTIVASTSTLVSGRRTEVLFPDSTSLGTNLGASSIFFIHGGIWKKSGQGNTDFGTQIITPDSFFIVRHGHSSIVASTVYTVVGGVDLSANATPLATQAGAGQDNPVTTGRPVPVSLVDLDLISSGAFVASTSQLVSGRKDELHVYDNAVAALNKSASAIYYYHNGNWKRSGTNAISDTVMLAPSEGFLIRKASNGVGGSVTWSQTF